jgi:hypothetical protein
MTRDAGSLERDARNFNCDVLGIKESSSVELLISISQYPER